MFDIRTVQEQVTYEAVKRESDDEKAKVIVYGDNGSVKSKGRCPMICLKQRNM